MEARLTRASRVILKLFSPDQNPQEKKKRKDKKSLLVFRLLQGLDHSLECTVVFFLSLLCEGLALLYLAASRERLLHVPVLFTVLSQFDFVLCFLLLSSPHTNLCSRAVEMLVFLYDHAISKVTFCKPLKKKTTKDERRNVRVSDYEAVRAM